MSERNKKLKKLILIAQIFCVLLTGCQTTYGGQGQSATEDAQHIHELTGDYDSADTAVIVDINKDAGTIQFKTLALNKYYTLKYDGATSFYDKNEQALTINQINEGDIVSPLFRKYDKRLYSLSMADNVFVKNGVEDFEIYGDSTKIKINGEEYSLDSKLTVITSDGIGEIMDISNVDVLCVQGYDHTVKSIRIQQGHGYIKLLNDSYFVGGWIDVGEKIISKIDEDMLLAVPAGTYQVSVSNEGSSGFETITVTEGQEYELDVSKWQGQVKTGKLIFTVMPVEAKVYIDGDTVNISNPVELDYGLHQMIIVAEGYKTISKYVKVGSASASLNINMEKNEEESSSSNKAEDEVEVISPSDNSASDNTAVIGPEPEKKDESSSENKAIPDQKGNDNSSSENKAEPERNNGNAEDKKDEVVDTQIISNGAKVYINGPENVEVYVDGKYVGLSPVNFPKKPGSITVSLRKAGFQTRSYTLDLNDDDEDVNYSFSELLSISE